jgi:hypothetical protein
LSVGLPAVHDSSTTNPAALYAVRIHHDDQGRPGYAAAVIGQLRDHLPRGAAIVDRSDLYPLESLAGTVKSVRLVDAVVLVGRRPTDKHSSSADPRIDVDPTQREVAEAAIERGVLVIVRSHCGDLHLLEECQRTDRRGGMRLVPPDSDMGRQGPESHE